MIPPKPKKQLGQHFLKDNAIAERICKCLKLAEKEYQDLLEIGPGKGVLTEILLENKNIRLFPVELDDYWADFLVKNWKKLEENLIKQDILTVDLKKIVPEKQIGVIGNFPYNIASQIVIRVLENRLIIPEMVGMFQLEVAQRLAAEPGNKQYGLLSVLLQSYYNVKLEFKLPPGAFDPPPKVRSAIIRAERKKEDFPEDLDFELFFSLVKMAFQKRRKKLSNALESYRGLIEKHIPELLDKRPEALTPAEFQFITRLAMKENA